MGTQTTVTMKDGGYYSERTRGAKHVIDNVTGVLTEAVAARPEPGPGSNSESQILEQQMAAHLSRPSIRSSQPSGLGFRHH